MQNPSLDWIEDRVPASRQFNDPYYSLANGLAETRHVFLAGNGLPGRFGEGFHIAELGFGTGLNLCAAIALWQGSRQSGSFRYTSFEAFPLAPEDLARALAAWPELGAVAADLAVHYRPEGGAFTVGPAQVTLIVGDARETLPRWTGLADAWFLDGFSPARNPELWSAPLLGEVAAHTARAGSFATYTAAGHVRRALAEAGFAVERVAGFGHKRHMTRGRLTGE